MEPDAEKRNLGQMCHALVCRRTEPAGRTMPLISLELSVTEILHTFRQVQPHFLGMKIFSLGGVQGAQHRLVKIWDTVYISETITARKSKILQALR